MIESLFRGWADAKVDASVSAFLAEEPGPLPEEQLRDPPITGFSQADEDVAAFLTGDPAEPVTGASSDSDLGPPSIAGLTDPASALEVGTRRPGGGTSGHVSVRYHRNASWRSRIRARSTRRVRDTSFSSSRESQNASSTWSSAPARTKRSASASSARS